MGRKKTVDSKEVGLEIGLHIFKFFLKTEYLHYGYFSDGLEADISNLAEAQKRYAGHLKSNIPEGTKSILDVGCGSGRFAKELMDAGYQVDAVSPGKILTKRAKELLGDTSTIFQTKFQKLETEKKYDLILFSESFQYIPLDESVPKALSLLNTGGYIMICDFFKTDPEKKSKLGGGHDFNAFLEQLTKYPLEIIKEEDITKETSPTIDLVNQFSKEVLYPSYTLGFLLAEDRFPFLTKLVKWKYRKKLEKIEKKHFSGERSGENFKKYKKYMFYLLKVK